MIENLQVWLADPSIPAQLIVDWLERLLRNTKGFKILSKKGVSKGWVYIWNGSSRENPSFMTIKNSNGKKQFPDLCVHRFLSFRKHGDLFWCFLSFVTDEQPRFKILPVDAQQLDKYRMPFRSSGSDALSSAKKVAGHKHFPDLDQFFPKTEEVLELLFATAEACREAVKIASREHKLAAERAKLMRNDATSQKKKKAAKGMEEHVSEIDNFIKFLSARKDVVVLWPSLDDNDNGPIHKRPRRLSMSSFPDDEQTSEIVGLLDLEQPQEASSLPLSSCSSSSAQVDDSEMTDFPRPSNIEHLRQVATLPNDDRLGLLDEIIDPNDDGLGLLDEIIATFVGI